MKRTCATNRLTARWVLLFLFAAAAALLSCAGTRTLWAGADETKKEVETAPSVPLDDPDAMDEDEDDDELDADNPADVATQVIDEIAADARENSAEDLLNLATEAKLSAESILDLTKAIAYCIEAEKKGLDEDSLDYCRKLKLATQLERGLALANVFMGDKIKIGDLPHGWETIRTMALEDLNACLEENSELILAQLAVGRLEMLPGGDDTRARAALDKAIAGAAGSEPEILAEALKFRALLSDDPQDSIKMLHQAIDLSKDNPTLLTLLATKLSEVNQDEEALKLFDEALALDPDNADYKKAKAFVLAALDREEEAEKIFDEAIESEPQNLLSTVEKAQFLASIDKTDKAIELISEAIDHFSQIPMLYYLRAELYLQRRDFRMAMRDVNQALRIDPSLTEAIQLKGVIYLRQEKTAEAVRIFEVLVNRTPDSIDSITQLAYARGQNNDYAGAVKLINKALKKFSDDDARCALLRCRGDIELLYGKFAAASATYDQILAMRPDDSGTLNNYAWLLATAPDEAARNGELALKYAQKASDLTNNKESHILSTLGAAYAETGDFDKALECANKAVEIGEKQNVDRLDDLKKEPESYLKKQPWRETPEKANVETTEPEEDEEDLFDSADEETEEDANSAAAEEAVGTLEPVNNAEADAAAEENPPEDRPMGVPAADAGDDGENN
ncbi:MAG: tetratricopeptide repeat protein [Thermoguttaceae bacterium]|nr:tetratricopeptide repeat protein [Thermoguttaceae bacterium]